MPSGPSFCLSVTLEYPIYRTFGGFSRHLGVNLIKPDSINVRPSVRPSTKSFPWFQRNLVGSLGHERWRIATRRYAVWSCPRSRSRMSESCEKWPISKSVSTNMHVIERITANSNTPRQNRNFVRTDFWNSSSFGVTWPSKLGYAVVTRSRLAILYAAYFAKISLVSSLYRVSK